MKRLVVGGIERVFEINRNFRNEGISIQHNPEFTMLEFYQAYATFEDLIELTQDLVSTVAQKVLGTTKITYQGTEIDLTPPYKVLTIKEALRTIGQVPEGVINSKDEALAYANKLGVQLKKSSEGLGAILTEIFDMVVQDKLIQPTFITEYPIEVSPLSRRNEKNPEFVDRFEFFIYGRELANGFTELNDPIDQEGRFLDQLKQREAGDDEAHVMDRDYITAMEYGLPPTGGVGIGIDRLVMLLTDAPSIRDVLLFPTMKPLAE